MIKNREVLEIIRQKKNEVLCENCKHCHSGAYHSGKWYCSSPNVSVFNIPQDIEKCFERRNEGGDGR